MLITGSPDDNDADVVTSLELPPNRLPKSLPRCCFFFLAKSYMSPKMPAKVLRKFFMVSSASSATEVCDCGAPGRWDVRDVDETVDDCDTWESRLPSPPRPGAFSVGCSGGSVMPLKLP